MACCHYGFEIWLLKKQIFQKQHLIFQIKGGLLGKFSDLGEELREKEGLVILREGRVDTPMHTMVLVKILSHLAVVEQFLDTKLLTPLERKIILNGTHTHVFSTHVHSLSF